MDDIKSKLTFNSYSVDEIHFENKAIFRDVKEIEELEVKFKVDFEYIDNEVMVHVYCRLFDTDYVDKGQPFFLQVKITGFFETDEEDQRLKEMLLEKNSVAILFPYLRSLISTLTANALVSPIILPSININRLLEKQRLMDQS